MFSRVLAALAACCLVATATAAQTVAPVEAFSRHPQVASPVISPDGRRIAMLSQSGGQQIVFVLSRDGEAPTGANVESVRVERLFWSGDDILIIVASIPQQNSGWGVVDHATMFALDLNDPGRLHQLFDGGRLADELAYSIDRANVIGRIPETNELVVTMRTSWTERRLMAIDPGTRLYRTIDRTTQPVFDYVVDAAGRPLARASYDVMEQRYELALKGEDYWDIVVQREEPVLTQSMWGLLTGTDDELVISERPSVGGRRLVGISASTGERLRVLFENQTYDFNTVIRDNNTNTIVGVDIDEDMPGTVWFDEALAHTQASLDAAMPNSAISLLSWSADRTQFTLVEHTADLPPRYYLYDASAGSLASLGDAYPELTDVLLPIRQSVRYSSRDGTRIPAYLTLPEGDGPHPMVVLPHGGPASRDTGGFDNWAQFLASRGYLVLQPNFRGSAGYGHAWESAGWGEWGTGIMQQDITDGVNAMARAGYADPERVCIVGASYGGYAALAGATFTPDLYQCAAAIAPLSDLWLLVRDADAFGGIDTPYSRRLAEQLTGTQTLPDRDASAALSPRQHAEAVQVPILLIHGRDDSVVDEEHSIAMADALDDVGKDVTFHRVRDMDHWLTSSQSRQLVLTELEAFLAEHLGE